MFPILLSTVQTFILLFVMPYDSLKFLKDKDMKQEYEDLVGRIYKDKEAALKYLAENSKIKTT